LEEVAGFDIEHGDVIPQQTDQHTDTTTRKKCAIYLLIVFAFHAAGMIGFFVLGPLVKGAGAADTPLSLFVEASQYSGHRTYASDDPLWPYTIGHMFAELRVNETMSRERSTRVKTEVEALEHMLKSKGGDVELEKVISTFTAGISSLSGELTPLQERFANAQLQWLRSKIEKLKEHVKNEDKNKMVVFRAAIFYIVLITAVIMGLAVIMGSGFQTLLGGERDRVGHKQARGMLMPNSSRQRSPGRPPQRTGSPPQRTGSPPRDAGLEGPRRVPAYITYQRPLPYPGTAFIHTTAVEDVPAWKTKTKMPPWHTNWPPSPKSTSSSPLPTIAEGESACLQAPYRLATW